MFKKILAFFQLGRNSKTAKKAIGKVKYFNRKRGFGFIKSYVVEDDIFVHVSDSETPIKPGKVVSFQLEENQKGYVAKMVEPAYQ